VPAVAAEFFLILLLILANGLFAGAEMAIVSARRGLLEQQEARGNARARAALRLAGSPNDFLATVQVGITLIGILSGAVGGATVAQRLRPLLDRIEPLRPLSDAMSVVVVVAVITYLSLVIGELVPKRIALAHPERIACAVAMPMRRLSRLTAPLVHLLGVSTDGLLELLGIRVGEAPEITEEEIRSLLRRGAESGVVEVAEQEMVERVLRLGDRSVKSIMTPRTEISWLALEAPREENLRKVLASSHARFPVARGTLDDCVGIVRSSRFLGAGLSGEEENLEALLEPALYVTEGMPALRVLEHFRRTAVHAALVTDEYGGVEGMVTLTDLMEAIVGMLPSREELEDPMVVQREDGSWLLDGLLDIGDFLNLLQLNGVPEEERGSYLTLGGLVLQRLGHIPRAGEHFEWQGFRLEVVDMDGKRVDKVLVQPPPPAPAAAD
jgi:putative hemolysin